MELEMVGRGLTSAKIKEIVYQGLAWAILT